MFHNTLVVGSSPTSSTTQSPTTGEIVIQFEMPSMVAAQLRAAPSQPRGGLEAWQEGEELAENGRNHPEHPVGRADWDGRNCQDASPSMKISDPQNVAGELRYPLGLTHL